MTQIHVTDDPRVAELEVRSCRQCRHYGEPEAPGCLILACLFAYAEAPGIELEPKRLRCRGWEPLRTRSRFVPGQLTLDGHTDKACPTCGRENDHGREHFGCQQRRERHAEVAEQARAWVQVGKPEDAS